jgi:uncharacterized membrane protein YfcA
MGYGTTLTPVVLLLGFEPLHVVPAVLLSEFVTGLVAAGFHHKVGNVRGPCAPARHPSTGLPSYELGHDGGATSATGTSSGPGVATALLASTAAARSTARRTAASAPCSRASTE